MLQWYARVSHGRVTKPFAQSGNATWNPLMLQSLQTKTARFSLDVPTIATILEHAKPLGHREDAATLNLGYGFLYYGLVRSLRPAHVVVIGSGYGFSVVCLALGLKDNGQGTLTFIDPSYSLLRDGPLRTVGGTGQWDDPAKVAAHFARFEVESIVTHHRCTSEAFFGGDRAAMPPIDLAFIDGNHSFKAASHDFSAVLRHCRRNSYVLLHDTNLPVREFIGHAGVRRLTRDIARQQDAFEIVDFPFASGVALVRVLESSAVSAAS